MQKNTYKILSLIVLSISINSCFQDVIDIDLGESNQQVVIEAVLTDLPEDQYVKVSYAGNYYTKEIEKPVSGAVVTIGNSQGHEVLFEESQPGFYKSSSIRGEYGVTYNLRVNVNGKEFSATSRMPEPVAMDSIKLIPESKYNLYFYNLQCYFTDKKDVENYLWFKYYLNDYSTSNTAYLYNDRNSDGKKIVYDDFDQVYITPRDRLRLEVYSLDKEAYNYLYSLFGFHSDIDIDLPELFPSNSFNPNTNISNNGLGYFSASAVKKYVVK